LFFISDEVIAVRSWDGKWSIPMHTSYLVTTTTNSCCHSGLVTLLHDWTEWTAKRRHFYAVLINHLYTHVCSIYYIHIRLKRTYSVYKAPDVGVTLTHFFGFIHAFGIALCPKAWVFIPQGKMKRLQSYGLREILVIWTVCKRWFLAFLRRKVAFFDASFSRSTCTNSSCRMFCFLYVFGIPFAVNLPSPSSNKTEYI